MLECQEKVEEGADEKGQKIEELEEKNLIIRSVLFLDHTNLDLLVVGNDNTLRRILAKDKIISWGKYLGKIHD